LANRGDRGSEQVRQFTIRIGGDQATAGTAMFALLKSVKRCVAVV
jgi:hypothetical protein